MAVSTNRALYNPSGGRVVYNPSSNRALYSAVKEYTISRQGQVYSYYGSDGVWGDFDETNHDEAQDLGLTSFKADTTLGSLGVDRSYTITQTYRRFGPVHSIRAARFPFTLPTGARGSIQSVSLLANCGGFIRTWDANDNPTTNWNGLHCNLNLMLSTSASFFGSGLAVHNATPDNTVAISTCNAAQSGPPPQQSDYYTPDIMLVSCAGLVSPMNNLSSDSFYLWAYIKPSTYLPYPGDMEYVCYAEITKPKFKLLIS